MARASAHGGQASRVTRGSPSRIGPNAVTRVAEALTGRFGHCDCNRVFRAAGLSHYVSDPPTEMVPDEDVARLHEALVAALGRREAHLIGAEAGELTARYLMAHRIPKLAQRILGGLPAMFALRLLLKAIGGHAWTFAGAGTFTYRIGRRSVILAIAGGPISRYLRADEPVCDYYAATFQTLFRTIITPRFSVVEAVCEAQWAEACIFTVRLA
jgi:divinyl protochlorophyllide a 8-vinyl-reductase